MKQEKNIGAPQFFGDISPHVENPQLISTEMTESRFSIRSKNNNFRCKESLNLNFFKEWVPKEMERLKNSPIQNLPKGEPKNINLVIRDKFNDLQIYLSKNDLHSATESMRAIAQFKVRDLLARELYYRLYIDANSNILASLLNLNAKRIILHISCQSRLDRAYQSMASFEKLYKSESDKLTHIIVIGGANHYNFDPLKKVLYVPASDHYEGLAEKIFSALAILSWVPSITSILKLDDDHRLLSLRNLNQAFIDIENEPSIFLWGKVYQFNYGENGRFWHLGKLEGANLLNLNASDDWGSRYFCWGGAGYFINAKYLPFLRHIHTYFRGPIEKAIYEDVFLGGLAEKACLTIKQMAMDKILMTTDEY